MCVYLAYADGLESVATVMDTEKAPEIQGDQRVSCLQKLKATLAPKKLLVGFVIVVCILAVMFGIGVLSAQYGRLVNSI